MSDYFPLLVFPDAMVSEPPKGQGLPTSKPHFPGHRRQAERLAGQLTELREGFERYKASVGRSIAGLEPEMVIIIEIAGSVDDFKQAVESTEGLEWQGEWELEDLEPNDDFYIPPRIGVHFFKNRIVEINDKELSKEIGALLKEQGFVDDNGVLIVEDLSEISLPKHLEVFRHNIVQAIEHEKRKALSGKLFVSLGNQRGLNELLYLWRRWEKGEKLPHGKANWSNIFNQALRIRRWGIEETLYETNMIERWRDLLDPVDSALEFHCQLELFYRRSSYKRRENEKAIIALLEEIEGRTLSPFLDMKEIAFHAVKIRLPAEQVSRLLEALDADGNDLDIQLFKFPGVMYFRPTGQSLVALGDEEGMESDFPDDVPESPPVAAILDGVPSLRHAALKNRLMFDDPDNLSARYQPGERRHGTAMASLVIHGELDDDHSGPLTSQVYFLPVMEPNAEARKFGRHEEHFPDDVFFEDRIERAIRRMLEGEGDTQAQAPGIKIINLSICDPERPFIHTPSPWARLLDWLAWKYRVLFCVSAGNFLGGIDIGVPFSQFAELSDDQKIKQTLKGIELQLAQRRLLSPAESLNALTIGALHMDSSGVQAPNHRIDLLPNKKFFSPVSRFGHGLRRSVKPEVLFPGGQQLYLTPALDNIQLFYPVIGHYPPGQKVAWDSAQEGERSKALFSRGTSNATALATRNGVRIHEVLTALQAEQGEQISDELIAVLIKTLLVHGARRDSSVKELLSDTLKDRSNARRFKEVIARYIGYGHVDIERILACTQHRATVLGSGEIHQDEVHEYSLPLPAGLSGRDCWRRMTVTLAWFSPINPWHRNQREAKLVFQPSEKWKKLPLRLERVDADHNQVLRGTVQHEVLEGKRRISAYEEDGHILLNVACKADGTAILDEAIPYGLAVTLEIAENIDVPIYEQIRERIRPQVVVEVGGDNR